MKNIETLTELVFTISRITRGGLEGKSASLSYIQFQALSFIFKNKNASMKEISKHLQITAPSTTILINNLVRLKLVSRIDDRDDRRLVRLVISQSGQKELEKGFKAAKKHLETVFSKLSRQDQSDLNRILLKLSKIFKKI